MLYLRPGCRHMWLTRKRLLLRRGPGRYAVRTTIETCAVVINNRRVVHYRRIDVGVMNHRRVDVHNRRIIGEISTSPRATDEANAAIAPTPITRCPEITRAAQY